MEKEKTTSLQQIHELIGMLGSEDSLKKVLKYIKRLKKKRNRHGR